MHRDAERRRAGIEDAERIVEKELQEWLDWSEGRAECREPAVEGRRFQTRPGDVAFR
jgi:glutamyl-tRNA reductase